MVIALAGKGLEPMGRMGPMRRMAIAREVCELMPQGGGFHAPRSIGLRSTEHRLTLHGASGYAPRSVKPTP
ncbi:MAG: hypothetical protein IKO60_00235 [Bacteroidaceae bacterium]|nr:hypothetical protein [Bacteroidaceae bacterium]